MQVRWTPWLVGLVSWSIAIGQTLAAEPAARVADTFVRLVHNDADEPIEMQTAVARYVRPKVDESEFHVDLVGAVHVGDRAYYQGLNKRFNDYEVVLYELVAPEGTKVPRGGGGGPGTHPVGLLQHVMKDVLELEHQLEVVNYQKKNFVHADMTPEQMAKSMRDRGESFAGMLFRAMGAGIAQQSKDSSRSGDLALLSALFDKNQGLALKRVMAQQMQDMDGALEAFNGPDGSTIITERNRVALEVLKKQLADGRSKVAIFYGAAHLPDMEARLLKDFGLERKRVDWVTAWNLRPRPAGKK